MPKIIVCRPKAYKKSPTNQINGNILAVGEKTNSKAIGVIIAFTALTTALNLIRIPVPYMPSYSYQIGDIALVVAFLIFGAKVGITIGLLSMGVAMTILIGPGGVISPPYNFLAIAAMLFGVYLSAKFVASKRFQSKINDGNFRPVLVFTFFSVLTRTLIMLPFDYTIYGFLVALISGLSVPAAYTIVLAAMPGIILYNVTVPLYVVPTSYYIAKRVKNTLKIQDPLKIE